MVTRCTTCNKPLALRPTAWACGPMFCTHECGVSWAKEKYEDFEYSSEEELTRKASAYFGDIAEEINREDYGADVEYITAYSIEMDMTTIFEQVTEGEDIICMECVGWYFGRPDAKLTESMRNLTAVFVD